MSQAGFALIGCGKLFYFPSKYLVGLDLLVNSPDLRARRSYSVKCDISPSTFDTFARAITGKSIVLNEDSVLEFKDLSEELGFHQYDKEIARLEARRNESINNLNVLMTQISSTMEKLVSQLGQTQNDCVKTVCEVESRLCALQVTANSISANMDKVKKKEMSNAFERRDTACQNHVLRSAKWSKLAEGLGVTNKMLNTIYDCTAAIKGQLDARVYIPRGVEDVSEIKISVNSLTVYTETGSQLTSLEQSQRLWKCAKSCVVPRCVEKIGEAAFKPIEKGTARGSGRGWSARPQLENQLKYIMFESGSKLVSIEREGFTLTAIRCIVLPSSLSKIGDGAFRACATLKHVVFPEKSELLSIGKEAFVGTCVEKIRIPSSVETIGDCAFKGLRSMTMVEIEVGSRMICIGQETFSGTSICRIDVPSGAEEIGDDAFQNCPLLNVVTLGSCLVSIGKGAFSNSCLREVLIPSTVKEIKTRAFEKCKCLKIVRFGACSQLVSIADRAFMAGGIMKISIPPNVKEIGTAAFNQCNSLRTIDFEVGSQLVSLGNDVFAWTGIESFLIPSNVETIGHNAFGECHRLKSVVFVSGSLIKSIPGSIMSASSCERFVVPYTVESIQDETFTECHCLKIIEFETGSRLVSIGKRAFRSTGIGGIVIPAKTGYIYDEAFRECVNLKSVEFEEGSQLLSICTSAFRCTYIQRIVIPASTNHIDPSAFVECAIQDFTVESGSVSFRGCRSLLLDGDGKNIILFGDQTSRSVSIPNSVEAINDCLFKGYRAFNVLEFEPGSHVVSIGKEAFAGVKVKSLIIPASVKIIDRSAFTGGDIDELSVEDGNTAFASYGSLLLTSDRCTVVCCVGLNATIPSTVDEIGREAFRGSRIEEITVPAHVRRIAHDSFAECWNLKRLEIANPDLRDRYFGSDFHGIIARLTREGGELSDTRAVEVSANSVTNNVYNVADFGAKIWYESADLPDQWLCWDFAGASVVITTYTICNGRNSYMKSWVVEVSRNGREWTQIDRKDNQIAGGDFSVTTHDVSLVCEGRFVRLRQTGKNSHGKDSLSCAGFEIFGSLYDERRVLKAVLSSNPLDGIMNRMRKEWIGNTHIAKVVNITASSLLYSPYRVTVNDTLTYRSCDGSHSGQSQWICFNFKNRRVNLEQYSLRSGYSCSPKSWCFEGSEDGVEWHEIDSVTDNTALHPGGKQASFIVNSHDEFQFLRLRQRGVNHDNNGVLCLSQIEIFGRVN